MELKTLESELVILKKMSKEHNHEWANSKAQAGYMMGLQVALYVMTGKDCYNEHPFHMNKKAIEDRRQLVESKIIRVNSVYADISNTNRCVNSTVRRKSFRTDIEDRKTSKFKVKDKVFYFANIKKVGKIVKLIAPREGLTDKEMLKYADLKPVDHILGRRIYESVQGYHCVVQRAIIKLDTGHYGIVPTFRLQTQED